MTTITEVKKRVMTALDEDEHMQKYALEVIDEMGTGVITLKGTVDSEEDRITAEKIARQQEGIVKVINDLVVESNDDDIDVDPPVILGKSTNA